MYKNHINHIEEHENNPNDPKLNNPFACHKCNKRYPMEDSLRRHIKEAHNEKKHICVTCGIMFETNSELKVAFCQKQIFFWI